jgi:hypothetical protein
VVLYKGARIHEVGQLIQAKIAEPIYSFDKLSFQRPVKSLVA